MRRSRPVCTLLAFVRLPHLVDLVFRALAPAGEQIYALAAVLRQPAALVFNMHVLCHDPFAVLARPALFSRP